jgi:hypothetical protein
MLTRLMIVLLCVCLFSTTAAAQQKTKEKKKPKREKSAVKRPVQKVEEEITLDVHGVTTNEMAKELSLALSQHGIYAAIKPGNEAPFRCMVKVDSKLDLGSAGQAVMKVAGSGSPTVGLDLVLFGKWDRAGNDKAKEALAKLKGVDANQSLFDADKGEIAIRIVGGAKVSADEIQRALKTAGIVTKLIPASASHPAG